MSKKSLAAGYRFSERGSFFQMLTAGITIDPVKNQLTEFYVASATIEMNKKGIPHILRCYISTSLTSAKCIKYVKQNLEEMGVLCKKSRTLDYSHKCGNKQDGVVSFVITFNDPEDQTILKRLITLYEVETLDSSAE